MRQRPAHLPPIMREPLTPAESRRYLILLVIGVAGLIGLSALLRVLFLSDQPRFDHVQFGSPYVLDDAHRGDLVIVAEQVRITGTGSVDGDVSIVSRDVQIEGAIQGNLTILSEQITLAPSASIGGNAALMGDAITVDGAVAGDLRLNGRSASLAPAIAVGGEVMACLDTIEALFPTLCDETQRLKPFEALIRLREQGFTPSTQDQVGWQMLALAVAGFIYCGGAALSATLLPERLAAVNALLRRRSGSLPLCWQAGLGTYALLIGGTALTLVLLAVFPPLGGIAGLALAVLGLGLLLLAALGWAAAGGRLGKWLAARQPRGGSFASAAYTTIGAFILVLMFAALLLLPSGALIAVLLALVLSTPLIGAAVLTLRR